MPVNLSFQKVFTALENSLNLTTQRHGHIISTLSNKETPGYRAKDFDFRTALNQAMSQKAPVRLAATDSKHIGHASDEKFMAEAVEQEGEWNGTNWVNIDQTMLKLIENNMIFRTATEALLRKINTIKEVIREGGQ